MKKIKFASLLLALVLPFSANAAYVCLKVNDMIYLKFKKPALTKATTSPITGMLVVPAAGTRPVMLGNAYGFVVIHSDGKIDYTMRAGTGSFLDSYDSEGRVSFALRNTDKKTFTSGTMVSDWGGGNGTYAYLYDADLDEYVFDTDGDNPQLSAINCKQIPAF